MGQSIIIWEPNFCCKTLGNGLAVEIPGAHRVASDLVGSAYRRHRVVCGNANQAQLEPQFWSDLLLQATDNRRRMDRSERTRDGGEK